MALRRVEIREELDALGNDPERKKTLLAEFAAIDEGDGSELCGTFEPVKLSKKAKKGVKRHKR